MSSYPLVVDIKRHSLEDGPGIRSVVFFKGCPLRCDFCQNPHTQEIQAEIAFFPQKCIGCGTCVDACDHAALNLHTPGRIFRDKCLCCGDCADACPSGAIRIIGTHYATDSLAEILFRDAAYYRRSNGGVTLSGGEATLFPDYAESLLLRLKARQIHTALQTCGHFEWTRFQRKMLPYLDRIYFDIKLADPKDHQRHTGKTNEVILKNLRLLMNEPPGKVCPRIPLIPGITATRENLSAAIDLLCAAGAASVELLPYNPLGLEMAKALGRPASFLPSDFMNAREIAEIHEMFRQLLAQKRVKG